jgi:hypothetical protein
MQNPNKESIEPKEKETPDTEIATEQEPHEKPRLVSMLHIIPLCAHIFIRRVKTYQLNWKYLKRGRKQLSKPGVGKKNRWEGQMTTAVTGVGKRVSLTRSWRMQRGMHRTLCGSFGCLSAIWSRNEVVRLHCTVHRWPLVSEKMTKSCLHKHYSAERVHIAKISLPAMMPP